MKTLYLSMLTVLWLTGCANHVLKMVSEDGGAFTTGVLVHGSRESNRLVLEMSNQRYEARGFAVERKTHLAELREGYYSSNPKHWDRVFSGLNTEHVIYSMKTIARSTEGHEISCHLIWQSGVNVTASGVCTDQAGTAFPVSFR